MQRGRSRAWSPLCKQLPCLCRKHHLAAYLSSRAPGQPSSPKPCKMADRARRVLRLNLREALSGLTRLKTAAGLPACAIDGPWEAFVCLICSCTMNIPGAEAGSRGGPVCLIGQEGAASCLNCMPMCHRRICPLSLPHAVLVDVAHEI